MRNVGCEITLLNQPIGKCFGNIIELREIYQFLSGENNEELEKTVLKFGANILAISEFEKDVNKSKKQIKDVISNGKALKSLEKLITMRNGNFEVLKKNIEVKNKIPVMSVNSGYIVEIDVNKVRQLAKYLNAIRTTDEGELDIGAGIVFHKKVGEQVHNGEIIAEIYTNNETKIAKAVNDAKEMFCILDKKVRKGLNKNE